MVIAVRKAHVALYLLMTFSLPLPAEQAPPPLMHGAFRETCSATAECCEASAMRLVGAGTMKTTVAIGGPEMVPWEHWECSSGCPSSWRESLPCRRFWVSGWESQGTAFQVRISFPIVYHARRAMQNKRRRFCHATTLPLSTRYSPVPDLPVSFGDPDSASQLVIPRRS
jgi:hypothetical protein